MTQSATKDGKKQTAGSVAAEAARHGVALLSFEAIQQLLDHVMLTEVTESSSHVSPPHSRSANNSADSHGGLRKTKR